MLLSRRLLLQRRCARARHQQRRQQGGLLCREAEAKAGQVQACSTEGLKQ